MELTELLTKIKELRKECDSLQDCANEIERHSEHESNEERVAEYLGMELGYISYRLTEIEDTEIEPTSYEEAIRQYCAMNIEDFESRVHHALSVINNYRCDLSFADSKLYCEILDAVHDWAEENGFDANDWNEEKINPDDVIFY